MMGQTHTNVSRRALLAASPGLALGAFAVSQGALARPAADSALFAAWERRCDAYRVLEEVSGRNPYPEPVDPRETAAWDVVDEAEKVIQTTVAQTPDGVAIQLWTALYYQLDTGWHDEVVTRRDLRALQANDGLDWGPKLLVAALTSLTKMEA